MIEIYLCWYGAVKCGNYIFFLKGLSKNPVALDEAGKTCFFFGGGGETRFDATGNAEPMSGVFL